MKGILLAAALAARAAAATDADPSAGQKLFAACVVCHDPAQGSKQGPGLGGVVGRKAAAVPGFRYSGAMRRSGLIWNAENLDAFLANPQGKVPGNVMPYAGMPDATQRAQLIAYLATLKE